MTNDRIRRAAEILRREAETIRSSNTHPNGRWSKGAVDERAEHDEMLSLAIELDLLAGER